jgi:hypothetical protein
MHTILDVWDIGRGLGLFKWTFMTFVGGNSDH